MLDFKIIKYTFFPGLLLLMFAGQLLSQEVEITNVTVLEDNDVQINWKIGGLEKNHTASLNIDALSGICYSYNPIHIIPDTTRTTFVDSTADLSRVRSYQIQIDVEETQKQDIQSNKFNTIHASMTMDTCQKNMNLAWTRAFLDQPNDCPENLNDSIQIHHYNIWRSIDGSSYSKLVSIYAEDDTSKIDTTFTDTNIKYDQTYKYYVEGVRQQDTTIKSKSNRIFFNTDMPDDPEYINIDSLTTRGRNIHLTFSIDSASQLNRYVLMRSENKEGPYDTLKHFNHSDRPLHYTDESARPANRRYYYHVAAVNQCGALTTRSDTINNIVLSVSKQNLTHQISWQMFTQLAGSYITYQVYRKGGKGMEGSRYELQQTMEHSTFTDDDIQSYKADGVSSEFCYYVTADIDHQDGRKTIVTSHKSCLYVKPQVFIPNAFIPNDNNNERNRRFRPELTFIPRDYLLIIYNRRGKKIFESHNYDNPWKGQIKGGKKAPAGTYIYYLEVKNPGQPLIHKKGQVTLIYRQP